MKKMKDFFGLNKSNWLPQFIIKVRIYFTPVLWCGLPGGGGDACAGPAGGPAGDSCANEG